jgi:hypothetical protein
VWIEARICQHFPVRLLVSCKRWKRKLHQTDIDHFEGERQSSGAHVGVLYSQSGFSGPAIEKARVLGISCCRLYQDEPPELPKRLVFHSYCCTSQVFFEVLEVSSESVRTFRDLFHYRLHEGEQSQRLIDVLKEVFCSHEAESLAQVTPGKLFPSDWAVQLDMNSEDKGFQARLRLGEHWKIWRGKLEAHLLHGSYNFSTDEYVGNQSGPRIDMQGPNPGPGWALLAERPSQVQPTCVIAVLHNAPIAELLTDRLGARRVGDGTGEENVSGPVTL